MLTVNLEALEESFPESTGLYRNSRLHFQIQSFLMVDLLTQ
jgi:hypothetical protein